MLRRPASLTLLALLLGAALVAGCSSDSTDDPAAPADEGKAQDAADVSEPPADPGTTLDEGAPAEDEGPGDTGAATDEGPTYPNPPFVPPDGVLRGSAAWGDLFAPLGVSTAGYGQTLKDEDPKSPFANRFRATTTLVDPPGVRVIHLVRGEQRVVLVQTDLIGIYYLFYERIRELVLERTGHDLHESLVLMANHSHAGPGHLVDFVIGSLLADEYNQVYFDRVMGSIADVVVEALEAEAVPLRFGHSVLENVQMHSDRRCENPEHSDDSFGLLRFERADGGGPMAAIVNYSLHGTVFSPSHGSLSGDAPRFVELKVSETLGGIPVLFAQSWAGDMAPADPRAKYEDPDRPVAPHPHLDRLEAIGRSAAKTVLDAWEDMSLEEDPELDLLIRSLPFAIELLDYEPGEFEYEFGGAFCGGTGSFCEEDNRTPDMTKCLPVPEAATLVQTRLTALRIGDAAIVTLPGEPLTTLGTYLVAKVKELEPVREAYLFGYAQDYTGYLLLPEDWYLGGYEAASNLWGPRQGLYLADNTAALAAHLFDRGKELPFEPAPFRPFVTGEGTPYFPSRSEYVGTVVEDLPEQVSTGDLLSFSWTGGDPWVDAPDVVLEHRGEGADELTPLLAGGRAVDQHDYRVLLGVEPDPSWKEVPQPTDGSPPPQRTFRWTARVRTSLRVAAPERDLTGVFRLKVRGLAVDLAGTESGYEVSSRDVTIEKAP